MAQSAVPLTRLIVLRHGETLWNVEGRYQGQLDSPLTERGVAQAHALARRLATESISALYTSNLGRARQTAQILAQSIGLEPIPEPGLRERSLGMFQGVTRVEAKARWPQEYGRLKSGDADYAPPDGESNRVVMARVIDAFNQIAGQHVGSTIAIITHGGPLSALLRHALAIPINAPRRFSRFNGSWNVFTIEAGKCLVETWGDISHLPPRQRTDV